MQPRRSHSAIIRMTHTYVSARVAYDGEEARSPKLTIHWAGSWCPIHEHALTWFPMDKDNSIGQCRPPHGTTLTRLPMAKRLTHLPAPHPLMIEHPLNLGRRCSLVWKPKKINRGPFPLDSDLSHNKADKTSTIYRQKRDSSGTAVAS